MKSYAVSDTTVKEMILFIKINKKCNKIFCTHHFEKTDIENGAKIFYCISCLFL